MRSILSKAKLASRPSGRPPAAVELAPQGVLAAATPGSGKPPVFAFEPLPAGALIPGIGEQNLRAPEIVANAIRAALAHVAPRTRSVTLVLPDTVVRVFVLDFDSLPDKPAEAIPILRFRLRKIIPFDVEQAGLSYQVLTESKTQCKVLATVLPGPILAEYEAAVRQAGYEPGAVLPSSLAALAAIDSPKPVLTVNLTALALTTSITHGQDLLLYRTLDLPEEPGLRLEEVRRDVSVAAAYFEDKLGTKPRLLYYVGVGANAGTGDTSMAKEFARLIDIPNLLDAPNLPNLSDAPDAPGLTVVDLAPRPETGAATPLGSLSLAGVTGALAGAA